jgi:anaerobic magnesium-protoporphyrin IX monomethyl ester cyclase
MTDCLIVGYNEIDFSEEVKRMKAMGMNSVSYKDFSLGYILHENNPYRAMDILNHFYYEGENTGKRKYFHNADVLWQVIMYLGTFLTKNGFSFDYVNIVHLEKDILKSKLLNGNIASIVITTTIYVTIQPILDVINFIRGYNKTAEIIVGGPFISRLCEEMDVKFNQSIFKLMDADFYIIDLEGEQTLVNLLAEIEGNRKFDKVNNIAYKEGGRYVFTGTEKENNPLEDNMIDFSLFKPDEIGGTINIRTSKSCPFSCAYCGFPLRAAKYSFITTDRVEKELDALRDLKAVEYINFIDDTFNIPKSRFKEILEMMIRKKYPFKWYSFYRCDFGDEEIIYLMKQAGCIGVFLGVESINDKMLERMNKSARKKDYLEAIPLLKKAGILTFVSTIIGFPGETYETAAETIRFIEESGPDFFRPQIWWCDPLTPIWKKKDEYGIKGFGFNWKHNTMDSETAYDLFEKVFMSVENSAWVPDPGFNTYGVYYLMQRGMTLDQILKFLKCFNSIVKEKIIHPCNGEIPEKLLTAFRDVCKYEKNRNVDISPVDAYSGAIYQEAERYWIGEFGRNPGQTWHERKCDNCQSWRTSGDFTLNLDESDFQDDRSMTVHVLASFGILLAGIEDSDKVGVIFAKDDVIFPIALRTRSDLTISVYLNDIDGRIEESLPYAKYALYILSNPLRMKDYACPEFHYGYVGSGSGVVGMEEYQKRYPENCGGLSLVLRTRMADDGVVLYFDYDEKIFSKEFVSGLCVQMKSVSEKISADSDMMIRELEINRRKPANNRISDGEFNFKL